MAFKLRSGNTTNFKSMGSSPAKKTPPVSNSTQKKKFYVDNYEENKDKPGFQEAMDKAFGGKTTIDGKISTTTKKSPAKQKLKKGGEGQDQDKIFNDKGEHIGDYVNDKPVMKPGFKRPRRIPLEPVPPTDKDMEKYSDLEKYDDDNPTGKAEPPKKKKSPAKQAKQKGLGPRTAFGGVKNPELVKTKKTKGKKAMIDGPKTNVTGVKNPGNWQPHPNTFKAKKSTVSKHGQLDDAEIEYQNDLKLLKKMNSSKKKKSPAKQAYGEDTHVNLEKDLARRGGVGGTRSIWKSAKKERRQTQENAIARMENETAMQEHATKQAILKGKESDALRGKMI